MTKKKKVLNSSTAEQIKSLMPNGEVPPEDIIDSAEALDALSVWADFKNSSVGEKFTEELHGYCSSKMVHLMNNFSDMSLDRLKSYLSEINTLLHVLNNINKSTKQYDELQKDLDSNVKLMFSVINSVSNRGA